jgi:hypothetical protein
MSGLAMFPDMAWGAQFYCPYAMVCNAASGFPMRIRSAFSLRVFLQRIQ